MSASGFSDWRRLGASRADGRIRRGTLPSADEDAATSGRHATRSARPTGQQYDFVPKVGLGPAGSGCGRTWTQSAVSPDQANSFTSGSPTTTKRTLRSLDSRISLDQAELVPLRVTDDNETVARILGCAQYSAAGCNYPVRRCLHVCPLLLGRGNDHVEVETILH